MKCPCCKCGRISFLKTQISCFTGDYATCGRCGTYLIPKPYKSYVSGWVLFLIGFLPAMYEMRVYGTLPYRVMLVGFLYSVSLEHAHLLMNPSHYFHIVFLGDAIHSHDPPPSGTSMSRGTNEPRTEEGNPFAQRRLLSVGNLLIAASLVFMITSRIVDIDRTFSILVCVILGTLFLVLTWGK